MRVLVYMARAGMTLAAPIQSEDGLPLFGRGTCLTARHLGHLRDVGLRFIEVVNDASVRAWETLPRPDDWLQALEDRFSSVRGDRQLGQLKAAVREVYLAHLRTFDQ